MSEQDEKDTPEVGGPDPDNYRQMQVPHESGDAATAAYASFFKAVQEARKKFRIAEATCVGLVKLVAESGDEGEAMLRFHLGDQLRAEGMAAFAYGELKREREDMMATLLAGNGPQSVRTRRQKK